MKTRKICLVLASLFVILSAAAAFAGVADLGGTSWRVAAYNVGKHNVLTPVEGERDVRVVFGRNGHINGAGINGFSASFSASHSRSSGRNSIEIHNIRLSNRHKYASAALHRQEQAILQAMRGAASYRMAGGQLDLLYRNGHIAATLLTTDDLSVELRRDNILSHANLAVPYDRSHLHTVNCLHADNSYTIYLNGFKETTIRPIGLDADILMLDGEIFRLHRTCHGNRAHYIDREERIAELWESNGRITIVIRCDVNADYVPLY